MKSLFLIIFIWYIFNCLQLTQGKRRKKFEKNDIRNELLEASFIGDLNKIEFLLNLDPNILTSRPPVIVDRRDDDYGRTSLMVCGFDPQKEKPEVDRDCARIAELMIEKGANITLKDINGNDALAIGAVRGLYRYCKILLKNNATVDTIDQEGRTPLMKATLHGQSKVVKLLLNNGANLSHRDNQGLTALHHATTLAIQNASFIPFFSKLLKHHSIHQIDNFKDNHGRNILMYAVINNNENVTRLLLENGADPRVEDAFKVPIIKMPKLNTIKELLLNRSIEIVQEEHQNWINSPHSSDLFNEL